MISEVIFTKIVKMTSEIIFLGQSEELPDAVSHRDAAVGGIGVAGGARLVEFAASRLGGRRERLDDLGMAADVRAERVGADFQDVAVPLRGHGR